MILGHDFLILGHSFTSRLSNSLWDKKIVMYVKFLNSIQSDTRKEITEIAVHLLSWFCTNWVMNMGKVWRISSFKIEIQKRFSIDNILSF